MRIGNEVVGVSPQINSSGVTANYGIHALKKANKIHADQVKQLLDSVPVPKPPDKGHKVDTHA